MLGGTTRMKLTWAILSLTLCLMGCSREQRLNSAGFTKMSGDLAPFVLKHLVKRGGHPNTNGITGITAEWYYKASPVQDFIFVTGNRSNEVCTLLRQAFGEPDSKLGSHPPPWTGTSRSWLGLYAPPQAGTAINFFGDSKQTGIFIGI
jgi:hypothetical protein